MTYRKILLVVSMLAILVASIGGGIWFARETVPVIWRRNRTFGALQVMLIVNGSVWSIVRWWSYALQWIAR